MAPVRICVHRWPVRLPPPPCITTRVRCLPACSSLSPLLRPLLLPQTPTHRTADRSPQTQNDTAQTRADTEGRRTRLRLQHCARPAARCFVFCTARHTAHTQRHSTWMTWSQGGGQQPTKAVGQPGPGHQPDTETLSLFIMFVCLYINNGSSHRDEHVSLRGSRPLRVGGTLCLPTLPLARLGLQRV